VLAVDGSPNRRDRPVDGYDEMIVFVRQVDSTRGSLSGVRKMTSAPRHERFRGTPVGAMRGSSRSGDSDARRDAVARVTIAPQPGHRRVLL
jgi:hypothetical protein